MNGKISTSALLFSFLLLSGNLTAQNADDFSLRKGQAEIGVFAPLRIGISDSLEISTHPLLFFAAPNVHLEWKHSPLLDFYWVSEHGIFYPTYLLRLLARKGIGGFISPEFDIPQMVSFYNGVVISKKITKTQRMSFSAGINVALSAGQPDSRTTIDLPFVYPRLTVFYSRYQLKAGMGFEGSFSSRWKYRFSLQGFFADDYALENNAYVAWNSAGKMQLRVSYFLSYARYPFGVQAHLIMPVLDVVWRFQ